MGELEQRIEEAARGLDRVGFCSPAPFPEVRRAMVERIDAGLVPKPIFTYRIPDTSTEPAASFPWAVSMVVGGKSYLPANGTPGPPEPGTGRVAKFAVSDAYIPLRDSLAEVASLLTSEGFRAEVVIDDSRLVDRAVATRAGIGWWGKSTMVIAPGQGPWMLLGSVVTDAPLAASEPMGRDCGTCEACIPACPTGALIAPGVLDLGRCLSAIAQAKGSIPVELREAMGDRIYGCDECLDACPPGRRQLEAAERSGRVDLVELMDLDDEELLARFEHFYVPGRKARFLRRNILVALGNSGTTEHLPVVNRYVEDPDPLLREHAEWAASHISNR